MELARHYRPVEEYGADRDIDGWLNDTANDPRTALRDMALDAGDPVCIECGGTDDLQREGSNGQGMYTASNGTRYPAYFCGPCRQRMVTEDHGDMERDAEAYYRRTRF